ncbi:hypothetical protein Hanom_Chr10g00925891 [Helianthus anomalus]
MINNICYNACFQVAASMKDVDSQIPSYPNLQSKLAGCKFECCKTEKRLFSGGFRSRSCGTCCVRIAGASRIIGVDLNANRFELGKY